MDKQLQAEYRATVRKLCKKSDEITAARGGVSNNDDLILRIAANDLLCQIDGWPVDAYDLEKANELLAEKS